jgi:hypothetical protein
MGHSIVMLSAAKHLAAQRDRPFASLRVTLWGSSKRDHTVMLSRSEASPCPARQTLRGVYTECNEWAQGESIGADFIIRLIFETALSAPLAVPLSR